MATCTIETGMLMWKKACGAQAAGKCLNCGREICGMHAGDMGDGTLLCVACLEKDPGIMERAMTAKKRA